MEQLHTLALRASLSKFWHNEYMTFCVPEALADPEVLSEMIDCSKKFTETAQLLLDFMKEDAK